MGILLTVNTQLNTILAGHRGQSVRRNASSPLHVLHAVVAFA
jgi:hypothetical protein